MRVRWILIAFATGIYFAWQLQNPTSAYLTVFGCMVLYSLRRIECGMVRTPESEPLPPEAIDYDSPQWEVARARAQEHGDEVSLWPQLVDEERERQKRILAAASLARSC
jgi:hypothetical protein